MTSNRFKLHQRYLSKNLYPHCSTLVGSRNGFECDLHKLNSYTVISNSEIVEDTKCVPSIWNYCVLANGQYQDLFLKLKDKYLNFLQYPTFNTKL